jgi:DNA-binding transcriptional ArsR family regulator
MADCPNQVLRRKRESSVADGTDSDRADSRRKRRRKKLKGNRRKPGILSQEALIKALSHPVRIKALTILTARVASPTEIADTIGMPDKIGNVSYHVRALEDLGLIEIVEEEPVRGSVAHFYKAVGEEVATADALLLDLAGSVSAGIHDKRDDHLLTRTPLRLDEPGWRKVRKILATALEKILVEQAAADERMNGSQISAIRAVLGQLLLETPSEGSSDS